MSLLNHLSSTLIATSCLTLIACSDSGTTTINDTLTFTPCETTPALQCGKFEVPLIHDSTDTRSISIDIARLPGTGTGPHEPLLINYGGPGSGIDTLRDILQFAVFPPGIRDRYDLIGFEQRGVAGQLRVDCDELGNVDTSPYPRSPDDVQTLVNETILTANACSAEYSDRLQHVGSNAVVRDMEIMRLMLNAPKLHMIGVSFGSRITTLYLERYPDNSGHVILDAPLPPYSSIQSLLFDSVTAEQSGLEQLLDACGTSVPDCDRSSVESAFVSRLHDLLDTEELDTAEVFFEFTIAAIEEAVNAEILAPVLFDFAVNGDPANMFSLIQGSDSNEDENDNNDTSEGEDADGDSNNSITLERAVLCADDADRPDAESLIATSLVIGGAQDVSTPISWAVETADAIGGVFLSSGHQGHTTVFTRDNICVNELVTEFLLEGTLPPDGTNCY